VIQYVLDSKFSYRNKKIKIIKGHGWSRTYTHVRYTIADISETVRDNYIVTVDH